LAAILPAGRAPFGAEPWTMSADQVLIQS